MEILWTVAALLFMAISSVVGEYLRRKFATDAKLTELYRMQNTIYTLVQSAEQKFNVALDATEQIVSPEQAEMIKKEREAFNRNKKSYVLAQAKRLFPNVDMDFVDSLIEKAVFEMNEQRKYLEAQENKNEKIIVVNNSNQNPSILDALKDTLEK